MSPVAVALIAPRSVALIEEPSRPVGPDEVRVRTLHSGISAGTELALYRGTTPFLSKRWDPTTRLFVAEASAALTFPVTTWGYEEVGEIVGAGDQVPGDLRPGTRVFGTWGHRAEVVASAAAVRDRVLPAGVDPLIGIFSHIGATALNGVLDARLHIGETVAIFGLGVVGQLVAQLVTRSGAQVIAVDPVEVRRDLAARLGARTTLDSGVGDVAATIKSLTDGRGADVCIDASGSTRALQSAIRACAYGSRVVALGFYQGEAAGLLLGEEFHHNRIDLVCSQIGGVAAHLQHRWNRLRLVQTFIQLAAEGAIRVTDLVTHRAPAADAAQLFQLIDASPPALVQAVIDFSPSDDSPSA